MRLLLKELNRWNPRMDKDKLFDALSELSKIQEEGAKQFDKDANDFWASLSYEEKLKVFHVVVSKIYKGDVQDKGSYRYVLYDVFGFHIDSYGVGMDCGYMTIHNLIQDAVSGYAKNSNRDM